VVKNAAHEVELGNMPDEIMPALAILPPEVFTEVQKRILDDSGTSLVPLDKNSVLFPENLRVYKNAAFNALSSGPDEAAFGGIASREVNDLFKTFVAGLPGKMDTDDWSRYRQTYGTASANELYDKFYDWWRVFAAWHEYSHAADYSKYYVESL